MPHLAPHYLLLKQPLPLFASRRLNRRSVYLVASRPGFPPHAGISVCFALIMMTMIFLAAGGVLTVASNYLQYPGKIGPTFSFIDAQDLYVTIINGMLAFSNFFLEPARLAILALLPAGAAFIAMFGPRYD